MPCSVKKTVAKCLRNAQTKTKVSPFDSQHGPMVLPPKTTDKGKPEQLERWLKTTFAIAAEADKRPI